MGQVCNSINRIYVDKAVASRFIEMFVEETKRLKIGNGLKELRVTKELAQTYIKS